MTRCLSRKNGMQCELYEHDADHVSGIGKMAQYQAWNDAEADSVEPASLVTQAAEALEALCPKTFHVYATAKDLAAAGWTNALCDGGPTCRNAERVRELEREMERQAELHRTYADHLADIRSWLPKTVRKQMEGANWKGVREILIQFFSECGVEQKRGPQIALDRCATFLAHLASVGDVLSVETQRECLAVLREAMKALGKEA